MDYEEIELSDGTVVRVAPVPMPLLYDTTMRFSELHELPRPTETVVTKAGARETVDIPDNDPRIAEWKAENQRRISQLVQLHTFLMWQEGIMAWKPPGAKRFTSDLPKGWEPPERWLSYIPLLKDYTAILDVPRILYLRYVLCKGSDWARVNEAVQRSMPITQQEVDAVRKTFPGEEER